MIELYNILYGGVSIFKYSMFIVSTQSQRS